MAIHGSTLTVKTILLMSALAGIGHHPVKSPTDLKIESPAFHNAGIIPKEYTCRGKSLPIPIKWKNVPKGTQSLALLIIDEDVPRNHWYHWAVFNIPPEQQALPTNVKLNGSIQMAANSWGEKQYKSPCSAQGEHHYVVRLYALDTKLADNVQKDTIVLRKAMRNHILGVAQLRGRVQDEG